MHQPIDLLQCVWGQMHTFSSLTLPGAGSATFPRAAAFTMGMLRVVGGLGRRACTAAVTSATLMQLFRLCVVSIESVCAEQEQTCSSHVLSDA